MSVLLKKRKRREEGIKYTKALHNFVRNNDLTMCKTHIKSADVNETDEICEQHYASQ